MNRFFGFIRKEFYHIFRDKRTLLILFGMPVVQILLFGYAITNEIKDANIAILDLSRDNMTQEITNKMLSSGYFRLYDQLKDFQSIEKTFQTGKVKIVIVFGENFAEDFTKRGAGKVQLLLDATDPNTASTLMGYITSIIQDYVRVRNTTLKVPINVQFETKMYYNEELKGVFLFVPGLITIILMLVSAMMTSISITKEKETGTMEVLLASPMKPYQVIIGKVIPYVFLAFADAIIILAMGRFVFGVPLRGSMLLLLSECVLFIFTALSLGIMISTFTNSQQIALMISLVGLMLPTILLSGFIFPIDNMPIVIQYITTIIPARWFIVIVRSIMLKGSDLTVIWKETAMLFGFTLLYITISVFKYKIRLS
jgi:ABC-2 type transport system permease protein